MELNGGSQKQDHVLSYTVQCKGDLDNGKIGKDICNSILSSDLGLKYICMLSYFKMLYWYIALLHGNKMNWIFVQCDVPSNFSLRF